MTLSPKQKRKRCKNGTRMNKRTGKCEKKKRIRLKPEPREEQDIAPEKLIEMINKVSNNALIHKLEDLNKKSFEENKVNILYPHLDDELFNSKLINKKEFNDLKSDNTIYDVEERSNLLCGEKSHFEILPHQQFVKNFLSSQTPYNGLFLYHGLGTGKTCSGISISEEMRDYMKQMGINKRIIIVASPNVQENFKLQLFDKRQLVETDGIWNIESCTGNKFLKEINPMNMKGLTIQKIEILIKRIINRNYLFMGPEQFSNYIYRIISKENEGGTGRKMLSEEEQVKNIKREFSNRLVVIDEIHNIKTTKDIPEKKTTQNILKLVEHAENLKLLALSATPMFNNPEEIVWLLNIFNKNDGRSSINPSDIFDSDGNLLPQGKEILIQKSRGYISYLRGDNPYTYPFRIYPKMFSQTNTMETYVNPENQLNGKSLIQPIEFLDLFVNTMQEYQERVYEYILEQNIDVIQKSKKGIGYQLLGSPLQCLNIAYPSKKFDEMDSPPYDTLIGKKGLNRIISSTKSKTSYKYKENILKEYGRIFESENIQRYSHKIYSIVESVKQSEGIILIYSQFIDGGCVPLALALEESGYNRVGRSNLFANNDKPNIGSYSMITGDINLSPNNLQEIKIATGDENINGEKIKVIIISEAGSEGIDLKNIRQIHIMEPWYNLNRLEQIIGRGVRTCSHKLLPFHKRNVQIFMYGTILRDNTTESADMYVYRLAERKAVKMGLISRILKENAIDCILNKNILTEDKFDTEKEIELGSKSIIKYKIGDKPYSSVCDYMSNCKYECSVKPLAGELTSYTYNEYFINVNIDGIIIKIKDLFREGYVFDKIDIIKYVNQTNVYPLIQINAALERMIGDKSIIIFDILKRPGNLINVGKFYIYQPLSMNNKTISIYDRIKPLDYKIGNIRVILPEKIEKPHDLGSNIFKTLKHKFKYRNKTTTILKGTEDIDWYKAAGNAINNEYHENRTRFINIIDSIDEDMISLFFISHMIDVMAHENKIKLLEYIFSIMDDDMLSEDTVLFRDNLFKRYANMMVELNDKTFLILGSYEDNKLEYYQIVDRNIQEAQPVDIKKLIKAKKSQIKKIKLSKTLGFMAPFKKQYAIFKIKDTTKKRDLGFRCDQKGKIDILRILNETIEESGGVSDSFTYESTKNIENSRELCVDQELFFRYYNEKQSDGKIWFLSLEDYLFTKLI